jgi:acetylornithine deacetylase/succinyl-diaminopimelate desuccinylase-like protein
LVIPEFILELNVSDLEMNEKTLDEATKLLQELIQNKCVNPPGNEMKSIITIEKYLKSKGIKCKIYESAPNRGNLVARIKGTGKGPNFMFGPSHVDVVPIDDEEEWTHPPFSATLADDFIWGRGSLDMLFIVAVQTVVFAQLKQEKYKPKGDLVLVIVSDEEMGGKSGIEWMLENHPEEMNCDFAVSEMGGINLSPGNIGFMIGEKGAVWIRLTFTGTPGHGSVPYGSDNAIVKAAEASKRLFDYKPPVTIRYLNHIAKGFAIKPFARFMLTNKLTLPFILKRMLNTNPEMAKSLASLSRMSISPNIIKGGSKTNTIPALATIDIDVRTLPGQDLDYIKQHIYRALGKKLAKEVKIDLLHEEGFFSYGNESSIKSIYVEKMEKAIQKINPQYKFIPLIYPGATDLRFLRKLGVECCGFALMDPRTEFGELINRIHGNDERISLVTLDYSLVAYYYLAKEVLS